MISSSSLSSLCLLETDLTGVERFSASASVMLEALSSLREPRFDMAYKDFPMGGNMHGLIGYLKGWMRDNNYATYALQSLSDQDVRAYFLRDAKSSEALLAQTLPLTNTQPLKLEALHLIYQQGGYWVYKIPPVPTTS